jgi:hypothetical protein
MKAIESNDDQPGAQKKLGLNSESAWGTQVAEPDRWLPTRDSLPDEGRGPANKKQPGGACPRGRFVARFRA